MSTQTHRTEYIILAALGLVATLIIVALGLKNRQSQNEGGLFPLRTTHSTNVEGIKVCYTLFERLGYMVQRVDQPLLPEALGAVDVLFLLDPPLGLQGSEALALEDWVRDGGVLIGTGLPPNLAHGLVDDIPTTCNGSSCRRLPQYSGHVTNAPTETSRSCDDDPLARDVHCVWFATSEIIGHHLLDDTAESKATQILFADTIGSRIVARHLGKGQVVALADTSFLANGWIGAKDNAVLITNLVAHGIAQACGRRVGFDEYHLGYGRQETGWTVMWSILWTSSPGWALLSLTAAGISYLWYRGRQFGTRRSPGRVRRRSKLEYVYAVGATYRASGAFKLTLDLIFRSFRRKAAARVSLPAAVPMTDLAVHLARRTGASAKGYETILVACEQAVTGPHLSGRRLLWLLHRLAHIESEISHGYPGREPTGRTNSE